MHYIHDLVFEAERHHLTAIAFRLLGSLHDAEDAVQDTWIKAATADTTGIRNPAAWHTTILTRSCVDRLRTRGRRGECLTETPPAEADSEIAADEHYLRREHISRALMVVLDQLTPPQRVAYVLHDVFDIPFDQVAKILSVSVVAAKKHASRGRQRIDPPSTDRAPVSAADDAVVDAFLSAAAGGDLERMLSLMAPDCVRRADPSLIPDGAAAVVSGAGAVAEETRLFADRIRSSAPIVVDGRHAYAIAPGGHLIAIIDVTTKDRLVTRIDITRPPEATVLSISSPAR